MVRQRIGNLEIWKKIILYLLACLPIFFLWFNTLVNSDVDKSSRESFLLSGSILIIPFIGYIFSHLTSILEYDEKFLYIVKIYYFKQIIDKCIPIEDITEILFSGKKTLYVTIKYGDKQGNIKCKKNDKIYKFLLNLSKEKNILLKEEQSVKYKSKNQLSLELILTYDIFIYLYTNEIANTHINKIVNTFFYHPIISLPILIPLLCNAMSKQGKINHLLWTIPNLFSRSILILLPFIIWLNYNMSKDWSIWFPFAFLFFLGVIIIPIIISFILALLSILIPQIIDD